MKRDMDLIRKILMEVEESDELGGWIELDIEGYSDQEVTYHVLLLHEAGLIEAADTGSFGGIEWKPERLTWHGHEFLDAARDDTRWNWAKSKMEKVSGFVFDVAKVLLVDSMKRELGLP